MPNPSLVARTIAPPFPWNPARIRPAHAPDPAGDEEEAPRLPKLGGHMPALDGLRGIAVLLVIVFHFVYFGGGDPTRLPGRVFSKLALSGWSGVDLFFVLSGFLITGILYENKGRDRYFRTFYARRVLRIFPLYYVTLALCLFVLPEILRTAPPAERASLFGWTYLTNVLIATDGWRSVPLSTSHFWSLAVEEQFYLFWPLVVFALTRRQLLAVCATCIGAAWAVRVALHFSGEATAAYVLTIARMDALAVGAAIALLARSPGGMGWLVRHARRVLLASGVALGVVFVWRNGLHQYGTVGQTVGFTLLAAFYGALLVTAIAAPAHTLAHRIFTAPSLRFFGRYSYGLYVFHIPVILLLRRAGVSVAELPRVGGYQFPAQVLFALLATALSTALALLSWMALEKHFLRLKDYFAYPALPAAPATLRAASEGTQPRSDSGAELASTRSWMM